MIGNFVSAISADSSDFHAESKGIKNSFDFLNGSIKPDVGVVRKDYFDESCAYAINGSSRSSYKTSILIDQGSSESVFLLVVNGGIASAFSPKSDERNQLSLDAFRAASKIASWEKTGQGRLASFFAVYFVEKSHKHLEFEAINKLLVQSDVDALSAWSLVALLRSTYPVRKFLPAWPDFLKDVRQKLEDSGEDAAKILRGLRY